MLGRMLAWFTLGTMGSGVAIAQTIEEAQHRLVVGTPPVLRLHVRGFEINPALVQADCFEVQLHQGDQALPPETVHLRTSPMTQDGKVLLQISSSAHLTEPVLHARIHLQCGADFTRDLTLLADPPPASSLQATDGLRTGTESSRPAIPIHGSPHSRASPPSSLRHAATSTSVARPERLRSAAAKAAHDMARTNVGDSRASSLQGRTARLSLEDPQVDSLVAAVLSALANRRDLPDPTRPQPSRETSLRPIEVDWLRDVAALQEEQRRSRAQLAALQLRLERQENDTLQRWAALAASAGGLLMAAWLLRLVRDRRLPRLHASVQTPSAEEPVGVSQPSSQPSRKQSRQAQASTRTANDGPEAPRTPNGFVTPPPTFEPLLESSHEPGPPLAPAEPVWPASPRTELWQGADFGEPSLIGSGHAPALLQVDQLSHEGYLGASVTILENALQARPGKSPWLLVRLLDLYRALGQPWNHERVSAQLEALYNVRVPPMADQHDTGAHAEGRTLDDEPNLLDRLVQLWPTPSPTIDYLSARLLRDRGLPSVDLAAFRELLFLYDMAREIATFPSHDPPADAPPESPRLQTQ